MSDLMVTHADWLRFMQDGTEPELPEVILESWRLYRCSGSTVDSSDIPRLSPEDFQKRTGELKSFLARLDEMVTRANLDLEGFVHFLDKDSYQLYSRPFDQRHFPRLGSGWFVGCLLSEEFVGNGVNNLAIRLRKPVSLKNYEHAAPIMHRNVGYAEPVMMDGVLIGSLGVYLEASAQVDQAVLLARTVTRLLVESCVLGTRLAKNPTNKSSGYVAKYRFQDIVFSSSSMRHVIDRAQLVSQSDFPILIGGESGVGKEYLAQAIHNSSRRKYGPFVPVNCASLSHALAESELFGYADGAFTGAIKGGHKGKFELANGGTIFLDEVGDLPLGAQAMLLRTLQEHEVTRIGGEKVTPVDVRVICASNKDLRQLCNEMVFRWDLYYRLAGITLTLPALRERPEDIHVLAERILDETNLRGGAQKHFSPTALQLLQEYTWPGNIRELCNIVETSHLLSQGDAIDRDTIAELLHIQDFVQETLEEDKSHHKKDEFIKALERFDGKVVDAAKQVGISRATAYRWMKEIQDGNERGQ